MPITAAQRQKYAENRKEKIHKRFYITQRTNLLLKVMGELMQNDVFDEFVESALLYGMAYLNDRNRLTLDKWTSELKLPTIDDVDEFYSPPKTLTIRKR